MAPSTVKLSLSTSCNGLAAFFAAGAFFAGAFLGGVSASRLSSSCSEAMSASEFSSSLTGVGGFLVLVFVAFVVLRVVCFLGAAFALGAAAFFTGAFF